MIGVNELERDLTIYFAQLLGLEIDKDIFRGMLPKNIDTGVSVAITGQRTSNNIEYATFFVQVLGKFTNRSQAWDLITELAGKFPKYSEAVGRYTLVYIRNENGNIAPFTNTEQGKVMQYGSVNFQVAVAER